MAHTLDLVVKNARVVRPNRNAVDLLDLGIKDGKFARLAPDIRPEEAKQVFDGKGLLAFPGLVDAHMHVGIYQQLDKDAPSESKAAAMGGVTTSLNYMRTGQYYLNRTGSYREFMPEVMRLSARATSGSTTPTTWRRSRAATSTRWGSSSTTGACRRTRSSCSTAATGCTASRTRRTNS